MNNEELLNQYKKTIERYEKVIDYDFDFITDLEQRIRVLEIENESLKGLHEDLEQHYQYSLMENEKLEKEIERLKNHKERRHAK